MKNICVCQLFFVILRPKGKINSMKEHNLITKMRSYQWDELTEEQRAVLTIAKEQTQRSYCPYSHFHVGAAAKLANGEVVRGCNQENAAYPSGLCAERSALFAAGAQYPDRLRKIHRLDGPYARSGGRRFHRCDARHDAQVLLYGENGTYVFESAADLLPLIFVSENLKG